MDYNLVESVRAVHAPSSTSNMQCPALKSYSWEIRMQQTPLEYSINKRLRDEAGYTRVASIRCGRRKEQTDDNKSDKARVDLHGFVFTHQISAWLLILNSSKEEGNFGDFLKIRKA